MTRLTKRMSGAGKREKGLLEVKLNTITNFKKKFLTHIHLLISGVNKEGQSCLEH